MAGKGLYRVGPKSEYTTIQTALDALIKDQGYAPFTAEQYIIVEDGVYGQVKIPDNALQPTSTYRLYIQGSKNSSVPIIDGSIDASNSDYGIYIGRGVPYVSVSRFQIQNFYIGILGANSCDYLQIGRVFVRSCVNAAVLANYVDNFTIHNSLLMDGDHTLAINGCKDVAVVHNTIFNEGKLNTGASLQSAVMIRMAEDYGNGLNDTGSAWIRNNVAVHLSRHTLLLYEDDLVRGAIRSDYNNLFSPNGKIYYVLKEGTKTDPITHTRLDTVVSQYGIENSSIGSDPLFLQPTLKNEKEGYKIDLSTLSIGPGVQAGEIYNPNSPSSMPAWIDETLFIKDFDNDVNRPQGIRPTLGAIQADGTYNLVSDPSNIPNFADCGYSPFQEIADRFKTKVWYPRVRTGHFFSEEKKYYLYANKQFCFLADCAITKFHLARRLENTQEISVYVHGEEIPFDNWDVYGTTFILYHYGLKIHNYDVQVEIRGKYAHWTSDQFVYSPYRQRLRISEGKTKFYLSPNAQLETGAPVVITDDFGSKRDIESRVHKEFMIKWSDEFSRPEIIFSQNSNEFSNSQFDLNHINKPLFWQTEGNVFLSTEHNNVYPYIGEYMCTVSGNSQTGAGISQIRNIADYTGNRGSYRWTWYGMSPNESAVQWSVDMIKPDGSNLVSYTGQQTLSNTWSRYGIDIGYVDTSLTGLNTNTTLVSPNALELDPSVIDIRMKIIGKNNNFFYLDAFQFEKGNIDTQYHKKPDLSGYTVEYEGSNSGFYEVNDLILTPVINPNHNGFLMIPNIPGNQFDTNAPSGAGTLSEYKWPYGRMNIIPWSRLSGRDKLSYTPVFNLVGGKGRPVIDPDIRIPLPKEVTIGPTVIQSLQSSKGEYFHVEVFDEDDNPYSFENIAVQVYDIAGNYPGVLERSSYSIPVARDTSMLLETNSAGRINLKWVPPEESDIVYVGSAPTGDSFGSVVHLDTKYKISNVNYGNITIQNQTGAYLQTTNSSLTSGSYPIRTHEGFSYIELPYYPERNSVCLFYQDQEWKETTNYRPEDKEFQVLYNMKSIRMNGLNSGTATVLFKKKLAWIKPEWGRRIFMDTSIFSGLSGNITVGYDADIICRVSASDSLVQEFSLIAQNRRHG